MAINISPLLAESSMREILARMHKEGPNNLEDFETLAHLKLFHTRTFLKYEQKLLYVLGLFYKVEPPSDLLEEAYSIFSQTIYEQRKAKLTA